MRLLGTNKLLFRCNMQAGAGHRLDHDTRQPSAPRAAPANTAPPRTGTGEDTGRAAEAALSRQHKKEQDAKGQMRNRIPNSKRKLDVKCKQAGAGHRLDHAPANTAPPRTGTGEDTGKSADEALSRQHNKEQDAKGQMRNRIQNAKRKLDVKFKQAGAGHRLDHDTRQPAAPWAAPANTAPPRTGTREDTGRAADAALSRQHNKKQVAKADANMNAKARMRREMELERKQLAHAQATARKYSETKEVLKDSSAVSVVLFKCPEISDVVLPKDEMEAHIHEFLLGQLAEEPEMASALMIHTLNKDREQVRVCVDTLCQYLDNIIANPAEEKYRKIRVANKAFKERISSLNGTEEFMQAAGFMYKSLPVDDHEESLYLPVDDHEETFYMMSEELATDVERLTNLKDVLMTAEPIKPQLDRNLKVYYPTSAVANVTIPDVFYTISPDELKKEQQRRQEAVEQHGMLRTKAMREREEKCALLKYRYTFIRLRFPDGVLLQGTFKATEKLPDVMKFIGENLQNDWMPFKLRTQVGDDLTEETKTLAELGLTPASLVSFEWDKTIMAEIAAEQGSSKSTSALKPETMALAQQIS